MTAREIGAERVVVGRDRAPSDDPQALLDGEVFDLPLGRRSCDALLGQEGDPGGVLALGGQVEVDGVTEEGVGDLQEHACTVAGPLVCAGRAAMVEVLQGGRPCATISWVGVPLSWATNATPQASCSKSCRYSPSSGRWGKS
jgi:hypothetical protein